MQHQTAVSIRPYELTDVPALYEAARESVETVHPWLPWCHPAYTSDESRTWVERQVSTFQAGKEFNFVISSEKGTFLGGCGLNGIDQTDRRANLGYWVRSTATGRGAATAATQLLVQWAFQNTDLIRLEVVVSTKNLASLRVAERAGAVREGILRNRLLLHGEPHDAIMLSFVRDPNVAAHPAGTG
ncbi:MAG: GNAT family N-acetyltransferase [Acidobacteria bacterium]|nr:GNAT family N-acetyltransferase [Acidobacteriota bacterium]